MNIEQAKQIDICDFFDKVGIRCAKRGHSDAWFFAPWRNERTASLHVIKNGTRWHDFGEGIGGDIIDLIIHLYGCSSTHDALAKLGKITGDDTYILLPRNKKQAKLKPSGEIISIGDLSLGLLKYSRSRGIHDELIMKVCQQVNFTTRTGRMLYGIGFKNDREGWEIRNAFMKRCIGPKEITSIIDVAHKPITVCEGFFDYLSLIEMGWITIYDNIVVLNSTALVNSAINLFSSRPIILCLDNDTAGKTAASNIIKKCNVIDDWSCRYSMVKDANEYLMR